MSLLRLPRRFLVICLLLNRTGGLVIVHAVVFWTAKSCYYERPLVMSLVFLNVPNEPIIVSIVRKLETKSLPSESSKTNVTCSKSSFGGARNRLSRSHWLARLSQETDISYGTSHRPAKKANIPGYEVHAMQRLKESDEPDHGSRVSSVCANVMTWGGMSMDFHGIWWGTWWYRVDERLHI